MPPPDSPSPPEPGSGGRSGSSGPGEPDPLEELTRRVRAAQEAADRVIAEAGAATGAGTARSGDRPPARGYAGPEGDERDGRSAEARALLGLLDLGRGLMPAELRHALADLVRELLMLLRALIDWYLERLELRRREPVDVEDIPIS
ncbi:MAG TPA: hypothetical protein VKA96_03675 [Solirubrobacteraceae bacterium]|nr:hypothetical protein [Solirubrobacteraceae bacterium]